ncbi:MAG: hypothetical protein DLM72_19155, partial [Candidatus Nitrosopolaris wilkensis]
MNTNSETNSERSDTNENQRIETISKNESLNSFGNYGKSRRIRIVGVGGSMREGSFSTLAVKMVL